MTMWSTVALLLWLALPPLSLGVLGRHYLSRCRTELDRARSYVDNTYADIDDLLERRDDNRGRHRLGQ